MDPSELTVNTEMLLSKIIPAVVEARGELDFHEEGVLTKLTTINNIKMNARAVVEKSDAIRNLVSQQKFYVLEALFDLHTGKVNFDLNSLKNTVLKESLGRSGEKRDLAG